MKFKTTLILLAVFAAVLAFVLIFESKSKARKETEAKEKKLVDLKAAEVEKIALNNGSETIILKKDDKGDWLITAPLEAKADSTEVNRLAEDFSSLSFERVVEAQTADLKKYEIPKKEITLWFKGQAQPIKILVGMENPIDNSLFAQREGDKRVVLLASFLKSEIEKKTFDLRQKDVFKFEVGDVSGVRLKAKDGTWEALKKDGEWYFQKPIAALAKKSRVEDALRALAGLKAKEFVSENKKDEEIAKCGLKDPEYMIGLSLPTKNEDVTFALHKQDDKIYATTSLSTKIIVADTTSLADIEKREEDLREKQVAVFNSWDADKLELKKGGFSLIVAKDAEGNWHVSSPKKEEADKSKVETFIRKLESLEAVEFIDSPGALADYGLAPPQAEAAVWSRENGREKESRILVGAEDPAKKQVIVKNSSLSYLFRVDSSFLADFPKEIKDWLPAPPEPKKAEEKKTAAPEVKK
jgi:flagellar basal body-associated protein FliL